MLSGIDDDTLGRFTRLVNLVPIPEVHVEMFADLACRAWLVDRRDLARRLMTAYCLPIVDQACRESRICGNRLVELAFPAIFFAVHPESAFEYLDRLPIRKRDATVSRAIQIILTRRTWTDPRFDDKKERFRISPEDARDACSLIEQLQSDNAIFFASSDLCETVLHKNNRTTFTAQQKERLASRLRAVFQKRLPDKENIQHDGYLILATACERTLNDSVPYADWTSLVDRGRRLTNTADKAYVLYELADRLPKKYGPLASEIRAEAFATADQIPSTIDRISRLIRFTTNVGPDGIVQAKSALRTAMLATFATGDQELARQRRREIIDVADKLGEDFADELADMLDEDPARAHARDEVRGQLRELYVTRKLANNMEDAQELRSDEESYLEEASWTSLNRLMSGRLESKSPEAMSGFVRQGSTRPIQSAYPVLSWHIENVARKYAGSRSADARIRAIVEQLLTSAELAISLVGSVSQRGQDEWIRDTQGNAEGVVSLGKRDAALHFIGEWLSECKESLIFCDPYFGPDDVSFLALVLANCPSREVTILTSKKELIKKDALGNEAFLKAWENIRDQDPPSTRVIAISNADSSRTPLHDRWLISGTRGLRVGTSFSSIGTGKLSEVSMLRQAECDRIGDELRRFAREESPIEGHKISYITFRL
jgi:hypothetical protein